MNNQSSGKSRFKRELLRGVLAGLFFLITFKLTANEIWTLTTAPYGSWVSVACSTDGSTLVIVADDGPIYVSTNSGAAWIQATNAPGAYWSCVAVSADGSKIAAGIDGGTIYTSHDYGTTWEPTTAPDNYWESITCSADGTNLAAAALSNGLDNTSPGQIHLSQDGGLTWETPSNSETNYWQFWLSISSSSNGSQLAAVTASGSIYISQNFGNTWTPANAPNENWFSVASSADGTKLVVVANSGPIYTSVDSGATWQDATNAPAAGWAAVACSGDGDNLAAVQWAGAVYISTNQGATWFPQNVPNTYEAGGIWGIAMSKNGSKILTAGDGPWGGPVYLLQPQPCLAIGPGSSPHTGVIVSWPASAGGFSLQANTSPVTANWTALTNIPEIFNGIDQDPIMLCGGHQYFRLAFPTGLPPSWWPHQPPPIILF